LESILNRDDPSGTHILYGGDIPMTAVDLLSGTKFSNLLLSFRQIYDLVILIAPPVAQGADTRILSRMADLTLLTMVADGSHPASLSAAVEALNDAKITDIATLWVG
jgi:Mrp family chromosome partitioning ATPase